MKSFIGWLVLGALALGLAGCGGGGNGGKSVFSDGSGSGTDTASASDMVLALSKSQIQDNGIDSVTATVTVLDANRNALAAAPVTVTVDSDAIAQVSGTATDDTGTLTATITPGANLTNRSITVTATSGSITKTASFQVTGAQITAAVLPSKFVTVGDKVTVEFRVVDGAGNPMANQVVDASGDGIAASSGQTDANGYFDYAFTVPNAPGSMSVTAASAGTQFSTDLQVASQAATPDPVPSGSVNSASVAVNPSVVSVNTPTDTSNQTQIRAVFVGASNNRIPNIRVRFDLAGDANSVGGTISTGNSEVYSDADGVATANYSPGTIASPTNGVTIRACWDYDEFAASTCPHSVTTTLTVVAQALKVSIGTDNVIHVGQQTYYKDYVVVVNDAAGQAKANVMVTPSVDLIAFYKGYYVRTGTEWSQVETTGDGPYVWTNGAWVDHKDEAGTHYACPNEDQNRNGVIETNEDLNGNGKLDPSGVTITALDADGNPVSGGGGYTTDSSGLMHVRIQYPQSLATWVDFQITATATVSGTEGKAVYVGSRYGQGSLPALAADLTAQASPAFAASPFGISAGCTNTD